MRTNSEKKKTAFWTNMVLVPFLFAVPFLTVIISFHGLKETLPTFHYEDETLFHYPIIAQFAEQFPRIDLVINHQ